MLWAIIGAVVVVLISVFLLFTRRHPASSPSAVEPVTTSAAEPKTASINAQKPAKKQKKPVLLLMENF